MRPVPTAVVHSLSAGSFRSFPGKVRASRRVEPAFSVTGLLKKLNAREGRKVRKGQVLAELDQRDYQYAFDEARSKYKHAGRELFRSRRLREQKVTTEIEFDNAQTKP